MNRQEAGLILWRLSKAYDHDVTDDELEIWYQAALERVDYETADRARLRLIAQDKWWPTPARFNEMRRAVEADLPADRQLPPARPSDAVWQKGIAGARAALRQARGRAS